MNKIETTLDKVYQDIAAFYKVDKHHFIVMNAIDMGDKMEIQWFFHDYENAANVTMFQAFCAAADTIPSICNIVASAWVAESELADL
jgi:ech hydrogenase subunit D